MANDYFQDITPPSDDSGLRRPVNPRSAPAPVNLDESDDDDPKDVPIRIDGTSQPPRGIRNIPASRPQRTRVGADMRPSVSAGDIPAIPPAIGGAGRTRGVSTRWWLWGAAALAVIAVVTLALLAFRSTTVTVTPRSHTIVLTSATNFTAYPAATAASGTLAYVVKTADLEDSAVVPMSGTTTSAPSKASGSITVYNSYSASPVKLIKNTRFQTPDGLIFRVPADVNVPGKKGTAPGEVRVTIVADAAGDQYNVGPIAKLTVPGLKSSPAMYAGIYAKSSAAMTGGSSGSNGPGVDPAAQSAAIAKLQSSLLAKARDASTAQAATGEAVLPDLVQITYATQPNTAEAGGNARIHETAHIVIPVFNTLQLGQTVGSAVAADANNSLITLVPGADFAVHVPGSTPDLSTGPLQFNLTGQADLVWSVDTTALAAALAGRDQGAFQTIIGGFTGIQEAHAKIEPFWKNTFPTNSSDIKIVITAPAAGK